MNFKTFLACVIILFIITIASAAYATFPHSAFRLADGKTIDLFGTLGMGNGTIKDVWCAGNCSGFSNISGNGTNLYLTGNMTAKSIGGVIYADQYATLQDAINATPANSKIIISTPWSGNNITITKSIEIEGIGYPNMNMEGLTFFNVSGVNGLKISGLAFNGTAIANTDTLTEGTIRFAPGSTYSDTVLRDLRFNDSPAIDINFIGKTKNTLIDTVNSTDPNYGSIRFSASGDLSDNLYVNIKNINVSETTSHTSHTQIAVVGGTHIKFSDIYSDKIYSDNPGVSCTICVDAIAENIRGRGYDMLVDLNAVSMSTVNNVIATETSLSGAVVIHTSSGNSSDITLSNIQSYNTSNHQNMIIETDADNSLIDSVILNGFIFRNSWIAGLIIQASNAGSKIQNVALINGKIWDAGQKPTAANTLENTGILLAVSNGGKVVNVSFDNVDSGQNLNGAQKYGMVLAGKTANGYRGNLTNISIFGGKFNNPSGNIYTDVDVWNQAPTYIIKNETCFVSSNGGDHCL